MFVSVGFSCLCNSTHRKLRCVGNFNRYTYQLANDILRFDFYTDLLSVVISHTILTYIKCQNQNENAAKTVTKTRIEGNVDLWDRDHRLCNTAWEHHICAVSISTACFDDNQRRICFGNLIRTLHGSVAYCALLSLKFFYQCHRPP